MNFNKLTIALFGFNLVWLPFLIYSQFKIGENFLAFVLVLMLFLSFLTTLSIFLPILNVLERVNGLIIFCTIAAVIYSFDPQALHILASIVGVGTFLYLIFEKLLEDIF